AVYSLPQTMIYNSDSKRYLIHFQGKLSFRYPPCSEETFRFLDHPNQPAQLEVWMTDTAGLLPGERFEYVLAFDRPGGGGQAEAFKLVASNPLGASGRAYNFKYLIATLSANPDLVWLHPQVPIEGDYTIVTDRAM